MPRLGLAVVGSMGTDIVERNGKASENAGKFSMRRLAIVLMGMAEKDGIKAKTGILLPPRLTQKDLASIIGCARETVTIQLQRLEDAGAISKEGRALIVHAAKLQPFTK